MVDEQTAQRHYEDAVAYYADRLAPRGTRAVRDWIDTHPDGAARARRDAAIERRLAQHYRPVIDEPIPPRLLAHGQAPLMPWVTRTAAAAVLVAAGGASGWWLALPDAHGRGARVASTEQSGASGSPQGSMNNQQIRVNDEAAAPDLSARGYQMVSRQRVAGAPQTLTEFVYARDDGARLRILARDQAPESSAEPQISFDDGVPRARWRAQGQEYALIGDLPPQTLRELARAATPRGAAPVQRRGVEPHTPRQPRRGPQEQPASRQDVLPAVGVQRQM